MGDREDETRGKQKLEASPTVTNKKLHLTFLSVRGREVWGVGAVATL